LGVTLEAVNAVQRFDYDLAGRLTRERHENVNGGTRTLAYAYYPTGELQAKQLADGSWTGAYTYDAAGRLSGLGNALFNGSNGATEPSSFIASTLYNARGQTTASLRPGPSHGLGAFDAKIDPLDRFVGFAVASHPTAPATRLSMTIRTIVGS
jgi:YD repeat-containing protein